MLPEDEWIPSALCQPEGGFLRLMQTVSRMRLIQGLEWFSRG